MIFQVQLDDHGFSRCDAIQKVLCKFLKRFSYNKKFPILFASPHTEPIKITIEMFHYTDIF